MPRYPIIVLFLLTFFSQQSAAISPEELLPPQQAFKLSAKAVAKDKIEITWDIHDGYYLYRKKLGFESQTATIAAGQPELPDGKIKHDDFFGDVEIYRGQLRVMLPLTGAAQQQRLQLLVKYQGCADIGVCYPPQKTTLDIDLPQAADNGGTVGDLLKGLTGGLKLNLFEDELLPAEQAFQFFASVKNAHTLHVNWVVADGYYLYRDKIGFNLNGASATRLGEYHIPRGEPYHDEEFGQVEIFHGELSFDIPLIRQDKAAQILQLTAKYQGCADRGVCYPPMQSIVDLALPIAQTLASPATPPLSEQDRIVNSLQQDTLWLTLLSFFGFGLLLSFTPCVFPMIPILSGIIVGHGKEMTTRKAFMLSFSYVLASALTYTAFGVLAALFGSNLQAIFQEPWVIAVFSGIFILLSLSMFGFYDLEMPQSLQNRLHHSSDKHRDGSYLGAFIMGSLSSLIVGPCVAAPLAAALVYIGQTGDVLLGGSALFVLGMGMGTPLLLIGASAGKLLPKAGGWLNSTKAVFGVIMLAVAVWMLDRIVPAPVTMLLWASLLIVPAIYLSAIDPLPQEASNWRRLWKGLGLIMLVYGVLLLIGVSAGNNNPLQPLKGLAANTATASEESLRFTRIKTVAELDRHIQQASANGQLVMLDFYADWCISCKEMEAYTFTDPGVQQQLANFVLLQADVTANDQDDQALLRRFNLIGPPGIIFFGTDRQELAHARVIGYQDATIFSQTIRQL
ncbi:protein-disulfide reductase DsbD [Methylomarinum vadi]|uniref:protein-disulfide reductase DsbD n=1 Tax=Methylomarinum vadi TaxID=438855 RepID=UPI0004DF4C5A|nr:protein-disulfide reductase DsbD [Methylomarinum vadi]